MGMPHEFSPTRIRCADPGCPFQATYSAWTIACLAASRHRNATGHAVEVTAIRQKTFDQTMAVSR